MDNYYCPHCKTKLPNMTRIYKKNICKSCRETFKGQDVLTENNRSYGEEIKDAIYLSRSWLEMNGGKYERTRNVRR